MANCKTCKNDFKHLQEDLYKNFKVPKPKQCPECRLIRRLQERNARKLYLRKCDLTGKNIISTFHEEHPFPVYDQNAWWGDNWDPMDYAKNFDFSRSFFQQFLELSNEVPHFSTFVLSETMDNSAYTNCAGYLKNCYLISESDNDEDCSYSNRIYFSKNLIDCTNCYECELCYEIIDCEKCYMLFFSQECINCHNSWNLQNCIGCKDCIACINQRHKQYMIFNKQYTKEEYEREKEKMQLDSIEGIQELNKRSQEFFQTQPKQALSGENNENTIGNYIYNSKNSYFCFDCKDLEDCYYCTKVFSQVKNCCDYTSWGFKAELVYQSAACGENAFNLKFCSTCATNNKDLEYCMYMIGCSDCFGCFGLKKKQYCILNKQYSKEEYETLKGQIINKMTQEEEYGEFFPIELNPYGYNETIAMDHFPLTKEKALSKGYKWSDFESPITNTQKEISANELPNSAKELDEKYLEYAIKCKVSNKPFKLTSQEFNFYKKLGLPLPKLHPDQRHQNRMKKRDTYKIFQSQCSKCSITINTSKTQQDKILCKDCYKKKLY